MSKKFNNVVDNKTKDLNDAEMKKKIAAYVHDGEIDISKSKLKTVIKFYLIKLVIGLVIGTVVTVLTFNYLLTGNNIKNGTVSLVVALVVILWIIIFCFLFFVSSANKRALVRKIKKMEIEMFGTYIGEYENIKFLPSQKSDFTISAAEAKTRAQEFKKSGTIDRIKHNDADNTNLYFEIDETPINVTNYEISYYFAGAWTTIYNTAIRIDLKTNEYDGIKISNNSDLLNTFKNKLSHNKKKKVSLNDEFSKMYLVEGDQIKTRKLFNATEQDKYMKLFPLNDFPVKIKIVGYKMFIDLSSENVKLFSIDRTDFGDDIHSSFDQLMEEIVEDSNTFLALISYFKLLRRISR